MKLFQITLSDQVVKELDLLKKTGWFKDENEIIQMALADFARLSRFALTQELPCDEPRRSPEAQRTSLAATRA
jgi:hypothetical protein